MELPAIVTLLALGDLGSAVLTLLQAASYDPTSRPRMRSAATTNMRRPKAR